MRRTILAFVVFFVIFTAKSINYASYFENFACRVDFHFAGTAKYTAAYLHAIRKEPHWGGRRAFLDTHFNLGEYRFQLTDSASGKLIYVDGFGSLFFEWQTTDEAKTTTKSFEQSIQFPYPKKPIVLRIDKRLDFEKWETILQAGLSPCDKLIVRNAPTAVPIRHIARTGSPENAVDIAIVAEGYRTSDSTKFFEDALKLYENLLSHEPFNRHKSRINVYAIAAASVDSGVSKPHENKWKNTALSSHFYTFYEPRYLTSPQVFAIRNYAALVPYDAIYILANTTSYGGGGIYNFYAMASSDSKRSKSEVVVHEFGHSFAGLADEYFKDSADVLDDLYDITKEPWEPNITSLIRFDMKWKRNLPANALIPTPVTDETKKLKLGVFEGGGYRTKGMYRPAYDCRMRSNRAPAFCPVCEMAVERMILFLTSAK